MKTIEIKGFWGFFTFALTALLVSAIAIALPISFTWVAWNALIAESLRGPFIEFWQAALLTLAIAVGFKIVFQPQISLQVKRVKSPADLERHVHKLKGTDSAEK